MKYKNWSGDENIKLLIPYPNIFNHIYSRYYVHEDERVEQNKFISSHWQYKSRDFIVKKDGELIKNIYGIGFGEMEAKNIPKKLLVYLCHLSYFIRLQNKLEIIRLSKLAFKICKKMGFYFSFDVFKQVCSLALINQKLSPGMKERRLNFLMIGDGYGFLSSLVKTVYPNSTIVLIDMGKTLLFQSFYCQRVHPASSHRSVLEKDKFNLNSNDCNYDFIYCPTEYLQEVSKIKFDIAINIASMQEMNYDTISRYFSFMRTNLNKDNLFYCCNREFKKLVGGEMIKFDEYPWIKDDKFLIDGYCPWYKYRVSRHARHKMKILNIINVPFLAYFDSPFKHRVAILSTR